MKELKMVTVYRYDDYITLDSEWFPRISGNKCKPSKEVVLMDVNSIKRLESLASVSFDYNYYDSLLDADDQEASERYLQAFPKDMNLEYCNFYYEGTIHEYMDNELVEDEFNMVDDIIVLELDEGNFYFDEGVTE